MQPSFHSLHFLFNVVVAPVSLVLLHFTGMIFSSLCMAVLAFQKHQNKQSSLPQVIFRRCTKETHIMDIKTTQNVVVFFPPIIKKKKEESFYIFKNDTQFLLSLLPAVHSAHEI